ncbi:MAG: hypothetical protein RMJ97_08150, partial [Raineya sp.]|nr:hypothetical protein [Raineya sp.]
DTDEMLYRMAEYYTLLLRKYRLPVKQYVFFIGGKDIKKMFTEIQQENFIFRFHCINLQDYDFQVFLNSEIPEEVILAILANFGTEKPEKVANLILQKIKTLPIETFRLQKCVIHLEILANLRNLQELVIKILEKMALVYDLEKDLRFKQGLQKGEQKGIQKGIQKGMQKGKNLQAEVAVRNMIKKGFSFEQIADLLEVSLAFVQRVAKKLKKD